MIEPNPEVELGAAIAALGEMLVSKGVCTQEELDAAMDRHVKALSEQTGDRPEH